MKLPAALLCAVSAAAFAGSTPACDSDASADYAVVVVAQDTTARSKPSDTTARSPTLPKRLPPKRTPRHCPACGMG